MANNGLSSKITYSQTRPSLAAIVALEVVNFGGTPLYESPKKLDWMINSDGGLFVAAYCGSRFAGYCAGMSAAQFMQSYLDRGWESIYRHMVSATTNPTSEADVVFMPRTAYVVSLELFPEFQGRGIGTGLFMAFAELARAKGFEYVAGHFRQGPSHRIATKLVPVLEEIRFASLGGDGETYYYVVARTPP